MEERQSERSRAEPYAKPGDNCASSAPAFLRRLKFVTASKGGNALAAPPSSPPEFSREVERGVVALNAVYASDAPAAGKGRDFEKSMESEPQNEEVQRHADNVRRLEAFF